ncbi:MAG: dihydropteroate synthase [Phycisphaerales bacterium]
MAILNVTPDSFSDGGRLNTPQRAAEAAARLIADGADILDIGGESTRPGAERVSADDQIARVVPAIRAIRDAGIDAPITIDTTRARTAAAALDAGADAVNDVSGGTEDPEMLALVAERGCGVVLMHRLRPPDTDSFSDAYERAPEYADVVEDVRAKLADMLARAAAAGIDAGAVVLDPGLGFGKTVEQNMALIRGTDRIAALGRPVLSGLSRKSFVGRISLGRDSDPSERLEGTVALSVEHLARGARVFRVHDPGPVSRALHAAWAACTG